MQHARQLKNANGGKCTLPPIFLYSIAVFFFGYCNEEGGKIEIFSKRSYGWCKDREKKKLAFYWTQNRGI